MSGCATERSTCARCLYFDHREGQGRGSCRYNPPVAREYVWGTNAVWPPVSPSHWCGKHRPAQRVESQTALPLG